MNNNPLDDWQEGILDNKTVIQRVVIVALGTVVALLLVQVLFFYLPAPWRGIMLSSRYFSFSSILIAVILASSAVLMTRVLNHLQPPITIARLLLYVFGAFFFLEVVYTAIQTVIILGANTPSFNIKTIMHCVHIAIFGVLVANISINKLRGNSLFIPVMLLIMIWLSASALIQHS